MQSDLISKQIQRPLQLKTASPTKSVGKLKTQGARTKKLSALKADLNAPRAQDDRSGLPANLRAGIEAMAGLSMDQVKVRRNSSEPAKVGALAFARDPEIHLAPGQDQHLPHEAWHIAQQRQGRVQATTHVNGIPFNGHSALEAEADTKGPIAANLAPSAPSLMAAESRPASYARQAPAQGMFKKVIGGLLGAGIAGYGGYVKSNYSEIERMKTDPNYTPSGQRFKALQQAHIANKVNPQGVASAAIGPLETALPFVGNFASGTIGDHYEQEQPVLQKNWDDATLEGFGKTETEDHWDKQTGTAYYAGKLLNAKQRAAMLKKGRTQAQAREKDAS